MRADYACCAAGLTVKEKNRIKKDIAEYATFPDQDRAAHMRKLIEGYYIKDKNHHCLQHNLEKLQGVDVRVNGERGLRAKRVRPICLLLAALYLCMISVTARQ